MAVPIESFAVLICLPAVTAEELAFFRMHSHVPLEELLDFESPAADFALVRSFHYWGAQASSASLKFLDILLKNLE